MTDEELRTELTEVLHEVTAQAYPIDGGPCTTCRERVDELFMPIVRAHADRRATADLLRYRQVVGRITYRDDYWFVVALDDDGRPFVVLQHTRPDAVTGEWGTGTSPKAYLRPDMTDSAIVRTCLGLALGYEEHEVREFFRYRGVAAYGPHIDVEALVEVAGRTE